MNACSEAATGVSHVPGGYVGGGGGKDCNSFKAIMFDGAKGIGVVGAAAVGGGGSAFKGSGIDIPALSNAF